MLLTEFIWKPNFLEEEYWFNSKKIASVKSHFFNQTKKDILINGKKYTAVRKNSFFHPNLYWAKSKILDEKENPLVEFDYDASFAEEISNEKIAQFGKVIIKGKTYWAYRGTNFNSINYNLKDIKLKKNNTGKDILHIVRNKTECGFDSSELTIEEAIFCSILIRARMIWEEL